MQNKILRVLTPVLFSLVMSCQLFFLGTSDKEETSLPDPPTTAFEGNENSPLGINLQGIINWSPELNFVNYAKRAREWAPQQEGADWGQGGILARDEHGYVTTLAPGQTADILMIGKVIPERKSFGG